MSAVEYWSYCESQLKDHPWTVVVSVLAIVVIRAVQKQKAVQKYGMAVMTNPPQGRPLPLIGHAIQFLKFRPWDLLSDWHVRYGSIVCFDLLGSTMFSLAHPDMLKIVLQSKIQAVKKDVANTYKSFMNILGTGIVTSENKQWIKQRLKMSHPLRIDVLDMIPRQTLWAVQRWMKALDEACESGQEVEMGSSLRHLTLQVISGTFLSLSAEESDRTFAQLYLPIVDESNLRVWHPYRAYCFFLPSWWKNWWYVYRLNQYVSSLIRKRWVQRRQQQENGKQMAVVDILDKMLEAHEKESNSLDEAAVKQMRDEMKTFMLAGHETSAAMMTWTFYELLGDSELMKQIVNECSKVFGTKIDWATSDHANLPKKEKLAQLVLAEASLKESLRKYSVVPVVARRTIQDLYLDDGRYFIPQKSTIFINIQAVHHNPEYWPKPMAFDPTRFIDKEIKPYTFLPFIAGPRNCLGQHLALLESKMVISLVSQRYDFSLAPGVVLEVNDWEKHDPRHRFTVPVIPQDELKVTVRRKKL